MTRIPHFRPASASRGTAPDLLQKFRADLTKIVGEEAEYRETLLALEALIVAALADEAAAPPRPRRPARALGRVETEARVGETALDSITAEAEEAVAAAEAAQAQVEQGAAETTPSAPPEAPELDNRTVVDFDAV